MTETPDPTPPSPRPLIARLLGSLGRVLLGCIIVAAAGFMTLATAKLYVHARRQVVPLIVTPGIAYEHTVSPPLDRVVRRMKEMVWIRLGWAPNTTPKAIAFTFDDGPYAQLTPQLLDLLKRHQVKATFFIEGKDAQMHPELVRRIADDGHELGNHSFTHASLVGLDEVGIARELNETDRLIRRLTGIATPIMRPPGGRLDRSRCAFVQKLGYTVVNDNDNPGDYRESEPSRLYDFILMHSSRCAIICLHSGRLVTIRALPTIIDAYRKKGYQFVTISELAKLEGIAIPPLPANISSTGH